MGFVNTPRRPHLTRFVVLVSTFILAYLAFHSGTWAFTRFVSLPPYFRFLLLVDLGIWCWATNVHVLVASGIDVYMLLDAQHRLGNENIRNENHAAIYGLAVTFTIITIVSMQIFMRLAEKWGEEAAEIVPTITFLVLTSIVLWPRKNFFGRERGGFLRSFKRTVLGGLGSAVPFCDVVLADILTSFSKVMGELKIVFTDLITDEEGHDLRAVGKTGGAISHKSPNSRFPALGLLEFLSPLLVCLPYLFRLRQCLAEYTQTRIPAARARHLANAIKYLSALPVVISGYMINWLESRYHSKFAGHHHDEAGQNGTDLGDIQWRLDFTIGLWIFFSIINSIFSIYWDIAMDWHLGNLRSNRPAPRQSTEYPFFLRPILHFRHSVLYYLAIIVDTLLRISWVVRVTILRQVVDSIGASKGAGVKETLMAVDIALKVLEILRRWVWVFFRVEREWVSRRRGATPGLVTGLVGSGDAMSPVGFDGDVSPTTIVWDASMELEDPFEPKETR